MEQKSSTVGNKIVFGRGSSRLFFSDFVGIEKGRGKAQGGLQNSAPASYLTKVEFNSSNVS